MFETHQRRVGEYARRGPEEMAHVFTFVLLTIQQSLDSVPEAMRDVRELGDNSRFLWGMKANGYRAYMAKRDAIYNDAMELWRLADPERAERELLAYFATLDGVGLVKAGFMVQLCFGMGGCLDTHHIVRFGLADNRTHPPAWMRAWHYKKAKPARKSAYLDAYLAALKMGGGCEGLWDDWCHHVAHVWPVRYRDAYHVSALHCEALGLKG